jgi:uncharacterized membrane protein YhaH (DUF805 family)
VPSSVRAAVLLSWALVLLSGLTMVLSIVLRDELIATWREGKSTELDPPAFVPVAITMFVVVALLVWVLAVMFRSGHGWARWAIAAVALLTGFSSAIGLVRDLPPIFVVLSVVTLLVDVALLVALFHPRTGDHLVPG